MPDPALPTPAGSFAPERLRGTWYLLFSNRPDWRSRTHARVEFDGPAQFSARFRSPDLLGRVKDRVNTSELIADAQAGRFTLRSPGLVRVASSPLCVAAMDPESRWAVLWHGRSSAGDPAGVDVLTRDPWLPQAVVDSILAAVAADPRLAADARGLFAIIHHWFPAEPYVLA